MPQQTDELRILRQIGEVKFEEEPRGYNKSQVDRVLSLLAPLADTYDELLRKLTEAETRVASAEARLLERSGSTADVIAPPAPPAPGEAAPTSAETIPAPPADFDETLRKTLVLAQRTADDTVKQAYDEAEKITGNAHSEADLVLGKARTDADHIVNEAQERKTTMLDEAETERVERLAEIQAETEERRQELETALVKAEGAERAELLEQIESMQLLRTALAADIEKLETHLAQRRAAILLAVDEIASALEDPSGLSRSQVPELNEEIDPVYSGDYSDVGILVEGLDAASDDADRPNADSDAGLDADPLGDGHDDSDATDGGPPTEELSTIELLTGEQDQGRTDPEANDPDFNDAGSGPIGDDGGPIGDDGPQAAEALTSAHLSTLDQPDAGAVIELVPPVDETIAVEQQVVSDEPTNGSNQASDPWAADDDAPPPPAPTQDPFLDELRKATSDVPADGDDALDRFLEGDLDDEKKPWFGRRK